MRSLANMVMGEPVSWMPDTVTVCWWVAQLLNGALAFLMALGLVWPAVRLVMSSRFAQVLLLAPWVRLIYTLMQSPTATPYLLRTPVLETPSSVEIQLGVGRRNLPVIDLFLEASRQGERSAFGLGDSVSLAGLEVLAPQGLGLLLGGVALVSLWLLGRRLHAHWRWGQTMRNGVTGAQAEATISLGLRVVRVVTVRAPLGPCTSGVWSPVILMPDGIEDEQREASIAHELAHVRRLDVLWFTWLGVLGDVFWFVPCGRLLERRFRDCAEEAADASAVRSGVPPQVMAMTILSQASVLNSMPTTAVGLGNEASRLERRIRRLLTTPRPRWPFVWVARFLLAAALVICALTSTFGGHA